VRRSGLLARLWPQRRRRALALEREVARLRALADLTAAASSAALVRAGSASHAAVGAELRAVRAEAALAAARDEVAALRADLAALREELVWAFAARAAEPKVLDLRDSATA
jgi:hypothetical protein